MAKMTNRIKAQLNGETKYHGKPCQRCKNTERWTSNKTCIKCAQMQKDGKKYRTWRAKHYRDRKSRVVKMKGGKCEHCKQVVPDAEFHLHWIDPPEHGKHFAAFLHLSCDRLTPQLGNVQLLCRSCHAAHHHEQGDLHLLHE